jgi:hypothetical protein
MAEMSKTLATVATLFDRRGDFRHSGSSRAWQLLIFPADRNCGRRRALVFRVQRDKRNRNLTGISGAEE